MTNFSDDFNRADSSDLGAGWVEVSGDWSIVSQQLSPGSAGGTIILRAASAMATDDNYAETTIAATTAASHGVWCRGNSSISNGYLWRNDGTSWDLFSVVGGSFTAIGTYAAAAAPGDIARVQAVGSTITAYVNGIQRVSVTDTNVATGTSVGIRSESTAAIRFDDFTAADVTADATLTAAPESDSAQPLTGTRTATLSVAGTVVSAEPLTATKTTTLARPAEQDTTQGLGAVKASALSVAGAVEAALPLTGAKTAVLGPALEADAARLLVAQSTTVPSPERTFTIPAERRLLAVPAENRTLTVR